MWYQEREEGVLLYVKVVPGSKRNQIVGILGDFLKIKITAPPEKGKANEELKGFLAKKLKISKQGVYIVRGQAQSLKVVFIPVGAEQLLNTIK